MSAPLSTLYKDVLTLACESQPDILASSLYVLGSLNSVHTGCEIKSTRLDYFYKGCLRVLEFPILHIYLITEEEILVVSLEQQLPILHKRGEIKGDFRRPSRCLHDTQRDCLVRGKET